ncbi:MAG: hypothetical protein EON59_14165 [Alphaproteobacteria bacterium]|nr:MAG: hypothetical protein EON59_14165 [Alphaproteobacteria bacterium]
MDLGLGERAYPALTALAQMYGFAGTAAQFAIDHIGVLKQADNVLANRCGLVLEAANVGFGLGGETALILIGLGQALLGNPLTGAAIGATSPIVMTCAAIGAVHYAWKAMSDSERETILKVVSSAFEVGVELIRSVASFSVDVIKNLMSRENFEDLKKSIAEVTAMFGRHLSDVTRALTDKIGEGGQFVYQAAGSVALAARAGIAHLPRPSRK